jgi:signal transduction histidine kinase
MLLCHRALSSLALVLTAAVGACAEPLRTLAEVQALTDEAAKHNPPVELEAVVLYADPQRGDTIVHDGTSSCFVFVPNPGNAAPGTARPQVGDRVSFQAFTQLRGVTPHIEATSWNILGRSPIPSPRRLKAEEVFSSLHDAAWIELPATVIGVETGGIAFTLVLEVYGHVFKADTPHTADAAQRAAALMQRPATMRAVFATVYNNQRQTIGRHFFVPSFDDIVPIGPEMTDGPQARPISVTNLLGRNHSTNELVCLEGIVTQEDDKGFYLRDESGSALVQFIMTEKIPPGTKVKVEGFGAIAPFRPILRATKITRLDAGNPALPLPMNFSYVDHSEQHMELVQLETTFLGSRIMSDEIILQCESYDTIFEAILPQQHDLKLDCIKGDRIKLVGICELTTTHPLPRPEWVTGFRLRLADSSAITLLHRAPWWNTQRLLIALGIMSGFATLGTLSTFFFRRVVQKQARFIGEKMSDEAVLGERDRMARDLHDTLEQQLIGVALQLDGIDKVAKTDPSQISPRISLARRMIRHTRVEARRSVWDLRSKVLEERGLAAALRSMAQSASRDEGPNILLEIPDMLPALPTSTEFHLLRIAQEALTNAIKHAQAKQIVISLQHTPHSLTLSIQDDGIGFALKPQDSIVTAHFGILGMQNRVEKIGASLDIHSSPGKGCHLIVTLLLPQSDEKP